MNLPDPRRILLMATVACTSAAAPLLAAEKDWTFGDGEMPERWSTVNSAYALCDAGLNQSPVDLGAANARGDIALSLDYGEAAGKLAMAKQKLQVDFVPGLGMTSGGKPFALVQVHFHSPSEHAIDGERFPLVAHFVHATDSGELGVLGVMFEEGTANPALQKIVDAMNEGAGASVTIDASAMVPEDLSVFRYMGSLTTPPCSEGVNWHVSKQTLTASPQQIAALSNSLGPSARSLQPLGSRLLVAPEGD